MDYIYRFIYYHLFWHVLHNICLAIQLGEKHQSEPMEHFCAEKSVIDRTEKSHTKIERIIPKMSIQTILYAPINTVHGIITEFLLIVVSKVLSLSFSLSRSLINDPQNRTPHTNIHKQQTHTHSEKTTFFGRKGNVIIIIYYYLFDSFYILFLF